MTITTQGNLQEKEVYIRISGSPGDEGKIISNRLYSNSALDWYPFPVSGGNVTITNLVEEGYVLDSGQQSRSFFKAQTYYFNLVQKGNPSHIFCTAVLTVVPGARGGSCNPIAVGSLTPTENIKIKVPDLPSNVLSEPSLKVLISRNKEGTDLVGNTDKCVPPNDLKSDKGADLGFTLSTREGEN